MENIKGKTKSLILSVITFVIGIIAFATMLPFINKCSKKIFKNNCKKI